jgi:hypothetical protein
VFVRPDLTARVVRESLFRAAAVAIVVLAALPRHLDAQILRIQTASEPTVWVSGGIGFAQFSRQVYDGRTQSVWRFGSGAQYRASIEKSISNQSTLGVTASVGRMPLRFFDLRDINSPALANLGGSGPESNACFDTSRGCRAHADVQSLGLTFHSGGGRGLYQVIEATGGATRYSSFRDDATDASLYPGSNLDASLTVGYGFGYSWKRNLQVALVQDYAAILHERSGLPSGQSALTQQYVTRLVIRLGAGTRRQGV